MVLQGKKPYEFLELIAYELTPFKRSRADVSSCVIGLNS